MANLSTYSRPEDSREMSYNVAYQRCRPNRSRAIPRNKGFRTWHPYSCGIVLERTGCDDGLYAGHTCGRTRGEGHCRWLITQRRSTR